MFKLKLALIFNYAIIALCYTGKTQETIPLYDGNKVPGSLSCPDREKGGGPDTPITDVTIPTLTVYEPDNNTGNRTAIIICPGGGYYGLSMESEGAPSAKILSKENIVAFTLKYRTTNFVCNSQYSLAPLQDLQQAIYKIRTEAARWKINPDKVGVLGFSAGGHLATLASIRYDHPQIQAGQLSLRPDFIGLVYPVVSFLDSLTSKVSNTRVGLLGPKFTAEQAEWFSSELHVTPNTPPTFIVHAADDRVVLVEQSLVYYWNLIKNKVPSQMIVYQSGGHGFRTYNKALNGDWIKDMLEWMKFNKAL